MTTQYYTAASLVGFIATEDDSLDWLFPRRVTNPPWRLVSVRQVGTGFAELRYELPSAQVTGAACPPV